VSFNVFDCTKRTTQRSVALADKLTDGITSFAFDVDTIAGDGITKEVTTEASVASDG
jgi:hypothetical protein